VTGRRADRTAAGGTLVLGGGFAGATVARELGRRGATVVAPDNALVFTPLLAEAVAGAVELRHISVPLRDYCPHATVVLGSVAALDAAGRRATIVSDWQETITISYEQLVVAVGSVAHVLPIPGLAESAVGAKTVLDAFWLRNQVLRELEAAASETDRERRRRHLTFVAVGGGYSGVETLAGLHDLARGAVRRYPELRDAAQRWVLVEAAPRILSELPDRLQTYATDLITRRGIEIKTNTTVKTAAGGRLVLSDGTEFEPGTLIWSAGVKPNPVLEQLGLPLDERGRIRVRPTLQVEGHDDIWAAGDCAAVPNEASGALDAPTSQNALRHAECVARNIVAARAGRPLRAYRFRPLGQVATLGRYDGIAEVLGLELTGFAGWAAARAVHLWRFPGLTRRLLVANDLALSLLLPRDTVAFGTLGWTPSRERRSR
jgi:NADH dehydrogenase